MYGIIYIVVKDLVINKFGEDAWKSVCASAQVPTDFSAGTKYEDQTLYKLVAAASAATKLSQPEVIEAVGYWFVVYIKNTQYGKLFSIIGANLATTLKNINALHGHVKMAQFHEMNIPTFRATPLDDCSLKLQYTPGVPTRVGLAPLVVGLVKGVAELVHNVTSLSINQTKWRGKGSSNDEWIVQWATDTKSDGSSSDDKSGHEKNIIGLDGPSFYKVHPFHFVFNKKLEIIQVGPSTNKVVRLSDIGEKPLLSAYFSFVLPKDGRIDSFSYIRTLWQNRDGAILVHNSDRTQNFRLQGEFVYLNKKKIMLFICSPIISSVEDANKFNLTLTDFAIHDPVKDIIISSNTTIAQAQQAKVEGKEPATLSNLRDSPSNSSTTSVPTAVSTPPVSARDEDEKRKKKPNVLASLFGSKVKETKLAPQAPTTSSWVRSPSSVSVGSPTTALSPSNSTTYLPGLTPSTISNGGGCPFTGTTRNASLYSITDDADEHPSSPRGETLHATHEYKAIQPRAYAYESERSSAAFRESLIEDSFSGFTAMFFLMDHLLARNEDTFDLFSTALLHFYTSKNRQISFLRDSFDREIDKSTEEKTLFRAESSTMRIWNLLCETEGLTYFKKLTSDALKEIAKSDIKEESLTANLSSEIATQVCNLTKSILNIVRNSVKDFPPQIQSLLYYIFKRVDRKFPGMAFRSIASLIFLRSLFPAMLKPERYSISLVAHKSHQKLIINVVKVLQNLVNNIELDAAKGGHTEFNQFITDNENQDAIGTYLESTICSNSSQITSQTIGQNESNAALETIKDVVMHNLSALFDSASSCPSLKRILMMQITTGLSAPH